MKGFLIGSIPWILLILSILFSVYIFKLLKVEKNKTAAATRKAEKMKLNIDRLTEYNSSDQEIRESAEKNIIELKEAETDVKIKEKLDKLYNDINNIYYGD